MNADTPKCDGSQPFAEAHGSANLSDVVKAAWRLRYYGYRDWTISGGIDECAHGIAKGIHCERCDELLLRKAYEQLSSPNHQRSEGCATTNKETNER